MADDKKMAVAAQLFKTGSDAVTKGNFDYAVNCFLKCVKLLPERLVYRQALRGAEFKMYKDNGKGAAMAKMKMVTATSRISINKSRKKWSEVMEAAEDALTYNPWDAKVLFELSYAANQAEMLDVATWVAEQAATVDKESADLYRLLGELYEKARQFRKAMSAWELVKKLDPKDEDAQTKAHQLAAQETIDKGKYENTEAFKSKMQEQRTAGVEGDAGDSPELRIKKEIAALDAKLAKEPGNVNMLVQVAELYRRLGDPERSAEFYQKAIDAAGPTGNAELKSKLLEVQIEPYRRNREIVERRIQELDRTDPDFAEKLGKLKLQFNGFSIEIMRREIEYFKHKASLNREDYNAQFEMGKRYLAAENFDEAIKTLQLGRNDMRNKWDALCMLGIAFWKKKTSFWPRRTWPMRWNPFPTWTKMPRRKFFTFVAALRKTKATKRRPPTTTTKSPPLTMGTRMSPSVSTG